MADDQWRRYQPQSRTARQGAPRGPQAPAGRGGAPSFRPQPGQLHMMKHPPEKKHAKHIKHPPKKEKPKIKARAAPDYVRLALGDDADDQDNPLWSLNVATAKRSIFWNNTAMQSWNRAKSVRQGSGASRKRKQRRH